MHLTVDFITKLPLVEEKDIILVVCDKLSKITHFVAKTEETLVERLVRLFINNVWKLHRLPESIINDREPQFAAELTKELNKIVTNFIQLVSLQQVDRFSQTKLHYKVPNEGYLHICGIYKSDNKQLRYQIISNCKIFVC